MKGKILLFALLAVCKANPQFQLSQKQAHQVASQLKSCVPVKAGENLNYVDTIAGVWHVVKIFDAPVQQLHSIPPLNIARTEDGNLAVSGAVPG